MADVIVSGDLVNNGDEDQPETKSYRLRPGAQHTVASGSTRKVYSNEESVDLTEVQFRAFKDKFIDPQVEKNQQKAREESASAAGAAPTPGIRQDDSAAHPSGAPTTPVPLTGTAGTRSVPAQPTSPTTSNKDGDKKDTTKKERE